MPEKIMSLVNEEIKYVIPLTDRPLRFDSVADDFFQIVGNVPFFKFLFMPFHWKCKRKTIPCEMLRAHSKFSHWVEVLPVHGHETFPL